MTTENEQPETTQAVSAVTQTGTPRDQAQRQDGPGESARRREAERRERAAQKLRENLQRRKLQARSRRAGEADETNGLPAAKTDESY